MAGAKLTTMNAGKSDAHYCSDFIYDNYIKPQWNGRILKRFDTYSDNEWKGKLLPDTLVTAINKGHDFIHVASHGAHNGWILEDNSLFTYKHNDKLNTNSSSIITTVACNVNGFHEEGSIAESILCNPNNAVVGFFGPSREGLGSETGLPSTTEYIMGEFYRNLFISPEGHKNFGKLVTLAKMSQQRFAQSDGPPRWLMYALNGMGDPEMPIFTSNPLRFRNVKSEVGMGVSVNTGVEGCTICLTGTYNGKPYQKVVRNTQSARFTIIPQNGVLCITKPGYLPYIYNLPDLVIKPFANDDSLGAITAYHKQSGVSIDIEYSLPSYTHAASLLLTEVESGDSKEMEVNPDSSHETIDISEVKGKFINITLIADGQIVDTIRILK